MSDSVKPESRQNRPLCRVAEQAVGSGLHEGEVLPIGGNPAEDAEDRLDQEGRLDDLAVDEMRKVVEMAHVIAFMLEARAVVLAQKVDDPLDVAKGVAEDVRT